MCIKHQKALPPRGDIITAQTIVYPSTGLFRITSDPLAGMQAGISSGMPDFNRTFSNLNGEMLVDVAHTKAGADIANANIRGCYVKRPPIGRDVQINFAVMQMNMTFKLILPYRHAGGGVDYEQCSVCELNFLALANTRMPFLLATRDALPQKRRQTDQQDDCR